MRDGATSAPTNQHSSKDMPAHTKLKYRKIGQNAPAEVAAARAKDSRAEVVGFVEAADEDADTDVERDDNVDDDDDDDHGAADTDEEIASEGQHSSEEDEDDTDELLRELEKIKREREEQRLADERRREDEMLSSNPLINLSGANSDLGSFAVKRRWDDDVVFKNQAKGVNDKPKKRFINDTTRSDFHRKFLDKYVR